MDLDGQFHSALVKQLRCNPANPVSKDIILKMGGQDYPGKVRFRPAASLRVDPLPGAEEEFGLLHEEVAINRSVAPFEVDYEDQFCPSINRAEKDHCVALTLVDMKIGDENVYDEIRAGVPYAYAVEDEDERAETTERRWREIFTAALIQKHPAELRAAMENPDSHKPIDLPIFYDCLLSPDMLRSFIQTQVLDSETLQAVAGKIPRLEKLQSMAQDANDNELGWCQKIWEDAEEYNRREITLKISDSNGQIHFIRVQPKLLMAITPCNELVYGGGLLSKSKAWVFADHVCEEIISELLGKPDPASRVGGYARKVMSRP